MSASSLASNGEAAQRAFAISTGSVSSSCPRHFVDRGPSFYLCEVTYIRKLKFLSV